MEKIVETKSCKQCDIKFEITDKDLKFYEKVSPSFGGKKYSIPSPTLCPDCRQQRRLSFRNERKLYKRKCDATGRDIISIYSPDKPYKVYEQSYWWSDNWNPLDYGRDFDFNRGFFEQFEELMMEVPKSSMNGFGNINCEFTNFLGNSSNCYFTIAGVENKDVLYSYWMDTCKNCVDCNICKKSENLYSCIECINCYNCNSCKNCIDCDNCYFSQNLIGKSNYWGNKECSNNEIQRNLKIINSQECVGNNLVNCYNCHFCFDIEESRDCKFGYFGFNMIDSEDFDYDSGSEMIYQSHTGYKNKMSGFLLYGNEISNSYYISDCFNSSNLFGCIGLRNKSYCILNKQYTKKEYETLVPKIIEHMMTTGEWGEFFPSSISPFGYNETVAQEYYPLDRKDTINRISTDGKQIFNWSTYEPPFPKVDKIIKASMLPESISYIPDDILNRAIMPDDECDENDVGTGFKPVPTEKQIKKPFRIIPQELEFYRKHNLPIPRKHPDQRHLDRMALRNPRKLFDRKCDKCGKDMKTTYSPDRKEIVYCEGCYNREVY